VRMVRPARKAESRRANRDVWPRPERALDRAAHPQVSGQAIAPRGAKSVRSPIKLDQSSITRRAQSTAPGIRRDKRERNRSARSPATSTIAKAKPRRACSILRGLETCGAAW
jgi:hypothetical protein